MSKSFKERLIESIRNAARYDSGNLVVPVAERISSESETNDFRPRTLDHKDLTPYHFEVELDNAGYAFPKSLSELESDRKIWMEK